MMIQQTASFLIGIEYWLTRCQVSWLFTIPIGQNDNLPEWSCGRVAKTKFFGRKARDIQPIRSKCLGQILDSGNVHLGHSIRELIPLKVSSTIDAFQRHRAVSVCACIDVRAYFYRGFAARACVQLRGIVIKWWWSMHDPPLEPRPPPSVPTFSRLNFFSISFRPRSKNHFLFDWVWVWITFCEQVCRCGRARMSYFARTSKEIAIVVNDLFRTPCIYCWFGESELCQIFIFLFTLNFCYFRYFMLKLWLENTTLLFLHGLIDSLGHRIS